MQPTTSASVIPSSLPLFRYMCLPSLPPSFAPYRLPPSRSLFPSSGISRRYVLCPELLFILISLAFCFSVVSGLRRKYKIIMIIMSHFTRNNTVGAGIRRESRAIHRANNVGRRGSAISRCSVGSRSFLRPYSALSPSPSISLSRYLSPFNGTSFFHSRVCLCVLYVLFLCICRRFAIEISYCY